MAPTITETNPAVAPRPSEPGGEASTAPWQGSARGRLTSFRAALTGTVLAATLALSTGCDNPACVFGGGCQEGAGTIVEIGTNSAFFPVGGQWIRNGAPTVEAVFPQGTEVHPLAPVVVVFSESLALDTLTNVFSIVPQAGGLGGAPAVIAQPAVLEGDGRVMLLLPTQPMAPADYQIVQAEDRIVTDLTGLELARPADGVLGTFTVTDTPSDEPTVMVTYPASGTVAQSDVGQIVVAFDRPVNSATVTNTSFVVTADGLPPAPNPAPMAFTNDSGVPDARVFVWRSEDAVGPVSLGTSAAIELVVSPAASPILDTEQPTPGTVPPTIVTFTTSPVASPVSSAIVSMPSDAIGIDAVIGPGNLQLDVQLDNGLTGDVLTIFVFGTRRVAAGEDADTTVFQRSVALTADTNLATLGPQELGLLATSVPPVGILADGPIAFAFRLDRAGAQSVVQVLDTDIDEPGIQDAVQDFTRPQFLGFGLEGTETASYRWDVRDLVVIGRSDEPLRAALVEAAGLDNRLVPGELPPVVGAGADGSFIAGPVPLGLIDPATLPLVFTLTIYDAALNATIVSPDPQGTQVGTSGPEDAGAPTDVLIEVFDALTKEPVSGAFVIVHEDDMNTILPIAGGSNTTDSFGRVTLPRAPVGETIVTVDAMGYDLFSFQEIPTNRLSIPLWPSGGTSALVTGTVNTEETSANAFTLEVADSRALLPGEVLTAVGVCGTTPFGTGLSCPFGPYSANAGVLGGATFLATDPPPSDFQFTAQSYLRAFQLDLPLPVAEAGVLQPLLIDVSSFLDDPTVPIEDRAVDLDPAGMGHVLTELATVGIDFGMLDGDPRITIEGLSPGLPRAVTVGHGVAFEDVGGNTWRVRAAYPGAVDGIQDVPEDELGRLVVAGVVEADLLVRHEFADLIGNRAGARPRLSVLPGTVVPLSVPALFPPTAAGGPAGGVSFNLAFENSIPDGLGREGLYEVTLIDGTGRRWRHYHPDLPDADGRIQVHFADVGMQPLASGTIFVQISAYTLPPPGGAGGPTLSQFLWTDIEREHEAFAHFVPFFLQYPN